MNRLSVLLVTLSLYFAGVAAQGALTINTPTDAIECQPTLMTWTGGTPAYFLTILPGSNPNGTPLQTIGTINGTSYTWNTNIAAGTSVDLTLHDSTGAIAQSAPFTIQAGTSTACLTEAPSSPATTPLATTPPAATPPGTTPPGTTPPGATTPATTPATAKPTGTTPATSAATATKTGAAIALDSQFGVAGALGAVILALLA